MNERTHFFIKNISLTFYSRKGWCFCGVWEMGGEIIFRERTSSFHLFFREPGCQCLHPFASWDTSDRLRVPRSTPILHTRSKSDRMVLIPWSPSDPFPVRPECPDAPSSSCLLIKMWQLTKTHGVTWNEPKLHVLCYITRREKRGPFHSRVECLLRVNFSLKPTSPSFQTCANFTSYQWSLEKLLHFFN